MLKIRERGFACVWWVWLKLASVQVFCSNSKRIKPHQLCIARSWLSWLVGAKLCAGPDRGEIPDLDDPIVANGEQLLLVLVHVHRDDAVLGVVERRQRRATAKRECIHKNSTFTFGLKCSYFTAFSDVWHGSHTRTSNSKPIIGMLMRFTEQVSQMALPQLRQWCCRMPIIVRNIIILNHNQSQSIVHCTDLALVNHVADVPEEGSRAQLALVLLHPRGHLLAHRVHLPEHEHRVLAGRHQLLRVVGIVQSGHFVAVG